MKKLLYLLFIVSAYFFSSCNKEEKFTITGQISGITDSTKIMLQNLSTGQYIDSSLVINSEFMFKGTLGDEPEELRIISSLEEMKKGNLFYTDLLMGNEDVQISGDISDFPLNVNTSGSSTQDEAEDYHKQLYAWNIKIDSLEKLLQSLPDTVNLVEKKQIEARVQEAKDSLEDWKVGFIKDNFDSYIGLLMYNYRRDFQTDTLKKLFNGVSEELKHSKYGRAIATQVNYPKPQTGDQYHDFEAINQEGVPTKLSEIGDQYTLLQFAGTGCYWSGLSIHEMKRNYEQYKDSVSFVSYFIDDKKSTWLNTINKDSIPWPSLWNEGGKYGDVNNKYGVTGTPTFFLISPDKKVILSWFGYEEGIIEKNIREATTHHNNGNRCTSP